MILEYGLGRYNIFIRVRAVKKQLTTLINRFVKNSILNIPYPPVKNNSYTTINKMSPQVLRDYSKMNLVDLCPDIMDIIGKEVEVLTAIRGCSKELKLRMELNKKSLHLKHKEENYNNFTGTWVEEHKQIGMPRLLLKCLFPYTGKRVYDSMYYDNSVFKKSECANIHGFLWQHKHFSHRYYVHATRGNWRQYDIDPGFKEVNVANLNATLTELGEKKFKSKKKDDKIKLLMKH